MTHGKNTVWFTWKGDNVQDTLTLLLMKNGLKANNEGLYISIQNSAVEEVRNTLMDLAHEPLPSSEDLAALVKNKQQEKWDFLLSESLLCKNYASLYLDIVSAGETIGKMALSP